MIFAVSAVLTRLAGRVSGNTLGMLLMVFSTVCLTLMHVSLRLVPGDLHPFELAFIRNLIGLLLLVALFAPRGTAVLRTRRLKLHSLRGVLNVCAMFAFFYGLPITPLAEVSALTFTAPLFASLLAIPFLRERLRPHRLGAIALGVAGMVLILRPGAAPLTLGPLLIVGSSLFWAVALIVIKLLTRTESSGTITLYMAMFMTPLSLAGALPFWQWPQLEQVLWLALVAMLGTAGQFSLAQSFRTAEATAVLPLDFLKLIWGSALGFLVFGEIPDLMTWLGGSVIFASTFYLALKESR